MFVRTWADHNQRKKSHLSCPTRTKQVCLASTKNEFLKIIKTKLSITSMPGHHRERESVRLCNMDRTRREREREGEREEMCKLQNHFLLCFKKSIRPLK